MTPCQIAQGSARGTACAGVSAVRPNMPRQAIAMINLDIGLNPAPGRVAVVDRILCIETL